jgi:hypothetical protein
MDAPPRVLPLHRSIVVVDVEGSTTRNNSAKAGVLQGMYGLVEEALRISGIGERQHEPLMDRGDGVMILIHPVDTVPRTLLLNTFVPVLTELLTAHNLREPRYAFRLRCAVHAGDVQFDRRGAFGEAIDTACRLLDAPELKAKLAESQAPLVLVVSEDIHRSAVMQGYPGIDDRTFEPLVWVRVGERQQRGWVHVPGTDDKAGLGVGGNPADVDEQIQPQQGSVDGTPRLPAVTVEPVADALLPSVRPAVDTRATVESLDPEPVAPDPDEATHNAADGSSQVVVQVEPDSESDEVETDVDWATDAPANKDQLNRASLADVLADRLREVRRDDPATSFLMHIDGPWGTGKSSLLNFLDERLADEFTIVRFDAWRQSRIMPPWWALLSATRRGITADRNMISTGWLRIEETVARARRSGAPYVLAVILLVVVVMVLVAVVWPRIAAGEPVVNVAKAVASVLVVVGTLWTGALVASRFLLWDSARGAQLFERSTANPMNDVAAHFDWILAKSQKPVLFFIDDLDRCPGPYVVDLLDSVQTLIRDTPTATSKSRVMRSACYFAVAADGAWLRKSYESAYNAFGDCVSNPGYPLGYLFLDKIFQLTVPVPVPTRHAQSSFLNKLLRVNLPLDATIAREVQEAKADIADNVGDETKILQVLDQASPTARENLVADAARALGAPQTRTRTEHALRGFLPLLHSNPRNIKKFLNTYSVLRAVRVLENNTISSETLALWTILKVRWPAMADALEAAPDAVRGIIDPLWAAECFQPELRELAADPGLRRVVQFHKGGPLTAHLIRHCCGLEDAHST